MNNLNILKESLLDVPKLQFYSKLLDDILEGKCFFSEHAIIIDMANLLRSYQNIFHKTMYVYQIITNYLDSYMYFPHMQSLKECNVIIKYMLTF